MKIKFNSCLLFVFIFLLGCSKIEGPIESPIESPTLQSNVIIIENTSLTLIEVTNDTTTFRYSYTGTKPILNPNDIIVGRPIKVNIDLVGGYIKRVTSVQDQGSQIIVNTTSAALTDAILNGDTDDSYPVLQDFPEGGIPFEFTYTPSDTSKIKFEISGRLILKGYFDVGIRIRNAQLEKLSTKFVGDYGISDTKIAITYTVAQSVTQFKPDKPIFKKKIPYVIMLGPIPININVTFDLTPGIEVGVAGIIRGGITNVECRFNIEAGLEYDKNIGPRRIFNTKGITSGKPFGEANISFWVKPFVEIGIKADIYSVAGVKVTPTPYIKADLTFNLFGNPKTTTKGTLGVSIGGKIVFNKKLKPLVSDIDLGVLDITLLTLWDETLYGSIPFIRKDFELQEIKSSFSDHLTIIEPNRFKPSSGFLNL